MTNDESTTKVSSGEDFQIKLAVHAFLEEFVKILEEVDPEMPLQRFKTLVQVSVNPEITTKQVAEKAKISEQSASRNLLSLGELNPMTKRLGYCLVESHENLLDRRGRRYSLSPRGRELMKRVENILLTQLKLHGHLK
jgi:DNA-binding MarR family transcriptional regulator